jgi:hypothetical protein
MQNQKVIQSLKVSSDMQIPMKFSEFRSPEFIKLVILDSARIGTPDILMDLKI